MNRHEFITAISNNNKIIVKRCTEQYLVKIGAYQWLVENTPADFISVGEKIKYLVYGGGFCSVCGCRTNVDVSGRGFAKYCKTHFHHAKKGKQAHNHKDVDRQQLFDLYINQKMSLLDISSILNVSNVTLQKRLIEFGIPQRTHSDNQALFSTSKGTSRPLINIDRTELISQYQDKKIPIKAIAEKYNCHSETIRRFLIQEGVIRYHRRSYIEHIIVEILDELGITYEVGNKKLLGNNLELDFYIPSHQLAIEVNGLYTHSLHTGKKTRLYHNCKYRLASDRGIKLLQFWECDIVNKRDIIKSMLSNACKLNSRKIFARKCDVVAVSYSDACQFFEQNHIQGSPGKNTKCVGLSYNGNIVSLVGYTSMLDQTTITRFCSSTYTNVVGAFTKLVNQIPGNKIVTHSSNDISDGALYNANGFTCTAENDSDMWYTDYKQLYNRQRFMKSKQHLLFDNFDSSKSEIDNMIINGYDVIYKSGTKTWVLDRDMHANK